MQQLREEIARMASSQEAMLSKQRTLEEELEKERAARRILESRVHALEKRSSTGHATSVEESQPPSESAHVGADDSETRTLRSKRSDATEATQNLAQIELRCAHARLSDDTRTLMDGCNVDRVLEKVDRRVASSVAMEVARSTLRLSPFTTWCSSDSTPARGQVKRHAQELRAGSFEQLRLRQTMEDMTSLSKELSGQGIRESQQYTLL